MLNTNRIKQLFSHLLLGLSFLLIQSNPTLGEVIETQDKPQEIILTIYPDDKALVSERRSTRLVRGSNKLLLQNIPNDVEKGSIILKVISPSVSVDFTEYSFQSNQISRQTLLEGSLGSEVQLLPEPLDQPSQTAKLIAINTNEAIVQTHTGVQVVNTNRIAFQSIPHRLSQHPLMTVKLTSAIDEAVTYEVNYLAHGLSWDASYTITVAHDASAIDMNSWIHIHNTTGVEFTKATVRIGEGNRENDRVFYSLPRPITLPNLSAKNEEWFTAKDVPTTRSYRVYSPAVIAENEEGMNGKPQAEVWLSVNNNASLGLGRPLPAGMIKVFQKSGDGRVGYMGENETSAITQGETFSLRLGNSDDIKAEIKQTDYRKLTNQVIESGYNVLLTNQTDRTLNVGFVQKFDGEWTILKESEEHEELAKDEVEWKYSLPPQESQTLRFRVRMKLG